jgi:DNA polymerase V
MQPLPINTSPFWVQSLSSSVQAGFPSPAEDHAIKRIDLMSQLITHPQATFMLRVRGDSMKDAGIMDGSVALIDKAIRPRSGHVVVACIDNEFVCKFFIESAGRVILRAANSAYPDITFKDGQTLEIWGVVVASIVQHPS